MITIDNQKQCTKCKKWQPATNECFGNKKMGALGLSSICKDCVRVQYELNREQISKRYKANPERAKEIARKWYRANPERYKETRRKRSRKWRESNPERVKENARKWKESNPERHKELTRKWKEANPDRYKELTRKWHEANPEKVSANRQQRRAREANAAGTSTAEQIKARFQYHENRCYYCGDSESGLHVEHRIPLSRGGSNWPANLVPACPTCNFSKHTKTEKEFINQ